MPAWLPLEAETAKFVEMASTILYCLVFFCLGIAATLAVFRWFYAKYRSKLDLQAEEVLTAARRESDTQRNEILVAAQKDALAINAKAEQEAETKRAQQNSLFQKIERREEILEQQEAALVKQQRGLENSQTRLTGQLQEVAKQRKKLDEGLKDQQLVLEKASGLSKQEATDRLLDTLKKDLDHEIGSAVLKHQKTLNEKLDAQSREMLLTAMQRYAATHCAETTTSTVDVPNDAMKGRIIGREGRNIRAFEKATGVDVIIDDTPGVVIVSGFDPVRREIARKALAQLIEDGRIHPSKIDEIVKETSDQIEDVILQKGQEAALEVNVSGLHERIIRMLGRLHFRTSYSQNVLRHSVEVAFIAGLIAEMMGMDGDIARRCGLLHDIGKAADHELEGGHPKIGGDLLARHKESAEVVHAARGHHDDIVTEHPYTMLVATADACSASRPGARRESLERYVKRMEELETVAKRFDGVQQAYAISAGRELRVMVSSEKTDDKHAAIICRDIAKAFESELTYPGEIKVTVIRESQFVETAK